MTWSEAYEYMQNKKPIRRVSWHERASILFYIDDESNDHFLCTSEALQYFDKQSDGRYMFNKEQHPSDDWIVLPYTYDFENNSWIYTP